MKLLKKSLLSFFVIITLPLNSTNYEETNLHSRSEQRFSLQDEATEKFDTSMMSWGMGISAALIIAAIFIQPSEATTNQP